MIKVVTTVKELKEALAGERKAGKSVGLVPTMGALHEGHASLVRRSVAENDITVVSDFVNPTQFNDKNDLNNYPRTMEADCKLLEGVGAQYVFAPSVDEIVTRVEQKAYASMDGEISSEKIGDMVMSELKELNDVAYVRFAAVYRKFTDVGTFMNELKKLVDEKM